MPPLEAAAAAPEGAVVAAEVGDADVAVARVTGTRTSPELLLVVVLMAAPPHQY